MAVLATSRASLPWMERSISLSPEFCVRHLQFSALVGTTAWAMVTAPSREIDRAISLSPIDPLNYAMLATRALSLVVRGDCDAAFVWAERATRSPGAHVHIYTIAAVVNEINGARDTAKVHVETIRRLQPDYHSQRIFPGVYHSGTARRGHKSSKPSNGSGFSLLYSPARASSSPSSRSIRQGEPRKAYGVIRLRRSTQPMGCLTRPERRARFRKRRQSDHLRTAALHGKGAGEEPHRAACFSWPFAHSGSVRTAWWCSDQVELSLALLLN